jgi:hypothetical protein
MPKVIQLNSRTLIKLVALTHPLLPIINITPDPIDSISLPSMRSRKATQTHIVIILQLKS